MKVSVGFLYMFEIEVKTQFEKQYTPVVMTKDSEGRLPIFKS